MSRVEDLIRSARSGDQEAKELLVNENAGLIWSVAKRFIGRGAEAAYHSRGLTRHRAYDDAFCSDVYRHSAGRVRNRVEGASHLKVGR